MRALAIMALATGCAGSMEEYFAQDVVEIHRDISYIPGSDNIRQRLDLFLPREVDGFPVVVFVHGGFWLHQDKRFFQPFVGLYGNVGIALAREGIGTAVISYRLAGETTFDEEFGDVAHAIGWVVDHIGEYGGAPEIVVVGHSAGGHMTALAGLDEPRLAAAGVDTSALKAFAPLSPILDVQQLADSPPSSNGEIVAEVFEGDIARNSPRTYFRAAIKPMLVVMGGDDLSALLAQVPPAVDELVALGAPVDYVLLPGKNHEDIVLDFDTDADRVTPVLAPFVRMHTH